MNYAVIETGGKQYQVQEGDVVFIEKLDVQPESEVVFDKIIAIDKGDGLQVGTPYLENAKVNAVVLKNGKSKKITVFTYKRRKNQKRTMGHRQHYTQVRIDAIEI